MAIVEVLLFGWIFLSYGSFVKCQEIIRLNPNVALNGTATQSSVWAPSSYPGSPLIASYAIDGNFETKVGTSGGACAVPLTAEKPVWWQVDLVKVYEIAKVAITVMNAYPPGKNIYIDISNTSDGSSAQQCAYEPNAFAPSETRVYTCPCEMHGRYVRIRHPVDQSGDLAICEVQIQPEKQFCPEPEEMDNAVRSVPDTQHYKVGTNITYLCDQCYTGGGTSICQSSAQCNREWSPVLACTIENCRDPGAIHNGKMEGRGPLTCISTIKYMCNEGYWLLGGDILACGIDGEWDQTVKPLCIDNNVGCGEPPKMKNAQRFGSVNRIEYKCDEGYIGGGWATCSNGEWIHNGTCENDAVLEDEINRVKETETMKKIETGNDTCSLILGLTAVGSILGGILITLVAAFLCRRSGIYPFARFEPRDSSKKMNDGYEKPNVAPYSAKVDDEEYAELDDMAGYEIPVSH